MKYQVILTETVRTVVEVEADSQAKAEAIAKSECGVRPPTPPYYAFFKVDEQHVKSRDAATVCSACEGTGYFSGPGYHNSCDDCGGSGEVDQGSPRS